jgi:hypothetical protein
MGGTGKNQEQGGLFVVGKETRLCVGISVDF